MISTKQEDLPDWSRDTFVGFLSGDSDQDQRNVRILLETVSLGNSVVAFDEFLVSVVEKTLLITTQVNRFKCQGGPSRLDALDKPGGVGNDQRTRRDLGQRSPQPSRPTRTSPGHQLDVPMRKPLPVIQVRGES